MTDATTYVRVNLGEVLALFHHGDEYEPLTATDVANELGCSRKTAYDKLVELETERTQLKSKKVGSRARVWWQPAAARNLADDGSIDSTVIDVALEQIDLPGTDDMLEQRRKAVRTAYDYLRDHQVAGAKEIKTTVYDSYPAGYKNPGTLWENCLLRGLKQLPGLECPSPGEPWRFVGQQTHQTGDGQSERAEADADGRTLPQERQLRISDHT